MTKTITKKKFDIKPEHKVEKAESDEKSTGRSRAYRQPKSNPAVNETEHQSGISDSSM